MGLTAIVYKSEKAILNEYLLDESRIETDPETGEVSWKSAKSELGNQKFCSIAQEFYMGNLAEINGLYNEIKKYLKPESVVLAKILYSGSHSGDLLKLELLPTLEEEIKQMTIENKARADQGVVEFISKLQTLVTAAAHHNHPIVFV